MSVNDDDYEVEARSALAEAGAIEICPRHKGVTIRVGDGDAERHAFALATNALKRADQMWKRDEVVGAIQNVLDTAADDECPECARLGAL